MTTTALPANQVVATVIVENQSIAIYDSGLVYPVSESYGGNITELVSEFHIPSSRFYYISSTGDVVPYLALSPPDQFQIDLSAWRSRGAGFPRVYAREIVEPSDDASVNIIHITEGKQIQSSQEAQKSMLNYLTEITHISDASQRFALRPSRKMVRLMFFHPFNPAANFILASQLASRRDTSSEQLFINNYLRKRGIITFKAADIINLSKEDIFFYLTRFYGPPKHGDLSTLLIKNSYQKRATNPITKEIVDKFNSDIYRQFSKQFDAIFNYLNSNPESDYYMQLGATNLLRFKNDFWNYLKLLGRPAYLPILTLNTIRQLQTNDPVELKEFLLSFTDQEITNLVGEQILEAQLRTRDRFVQQAANYLVQTLIFLLLPNEAALCNNPETSIGLEEFAELGHAYVGKGSLAAGFDCYDIPELFNYFEHNKDADGKYVFRNPVNAEVEFTINDLTAFRDATRSGRGGVPVNERIVEKFQGYIDQALLQRSDDFEKVLLLRRFVEESPANRQLIKDLFKSYFNMGMYMRQWTGPGHPYPLIEEQTGHTEHGLDRAPGWVDENVTHERINNFEPSLERLPQNLRDTFWGLEVLVYREGRGNRTGRTIKRRYDNTIVRGTYCIRMASAPWAYTGAYYYKQTTGENIPGFNLSTGIVFIY